MLAINDNARNTQRRSGPTRTPRRSRRKTPGIACQPWATSPHALAVRFSAVFEYTVSGCDVSTGQGPGAAAAVEGGPVNAAAQPAPELNARRLPPGRAGVLVRSRAPGGASRRRSGLPGLCHGLIGLPGRGVRVPRGCRGRAAGIDLLPRGACGAWPAWVRVPARGLARRAEDDYQPRSQQDEDNHGHDEHRRNRHGRTRVSQEIPFLRRQAAGLLLTVPARYRSRGRS